jgi:hypothetical protein
MQWIAAFFGMIGIGLAFSVGLLFLLAILAGVLLS